MQPPQLRCARCGAQFKITNQDAALVAVVMAASGSGESTRRTVERAIGKWRGSTIGGYLRGDDETYLFNFRCSKHRFGHLVGLLAGSQLDLAPERTTHVVGRHGRRVRAAHTARDPPELRFKVAMCMYALGHEGSTKVKADGSGGVYDRTHRQYGTRADRWAQSALPRCPPLPFTHRLCVR